MSDKRPKRHGTADDRALAGRHGRSPAFGVPVDHDDDLTPPPAEPPSPSDIDDYDTIAPPIKRQLEAIQEKNVEVVAAIKQLWDSRKYGERLEQLDSKLGVLAGYATEQATLLRDFLMPAVKDCMNAADGIARQIPVILAQVEATSQLVRMLDTRFHVLEVEVKTNFERVNSRTTELTNDQVSLERRLENHLIRIEVLEQTAKTKEAVSKALVKAERRKQSGMSALVAAVVTAITALISKYI